MQTDARVLLNLAAEERQQLRSQGSRYIPGQKNFLGKFPTEFVRERGAARRACSSRIYSACNVSACVSRLKASLLRFRVDIGFARRFALPFARLASSLFRQPRDPHSVFLCVFFNSSTDATITLPPPRRFPSLFPSRQQYRGIFASGKSESSEMFVKERWREWNLKKRRYKVTPDFPLPAAGSMVWSRRVNSEHTRPRKLALCDEDQHRETGHDYYRILTL